MLYGYQRIVSQKAEAEAELLEDLGVSFHVASCCELNGVIQTGSEPG